MQLLRLLQVGVSASYRAQGALPAASGRGIRDELYLQRRNREASFLLDLRHQIVLRASLAPGWLERQRALSGSGDGRGHRGQAFQRPRMGEAIAGRSRVVP